MYPIKKYSLVIERRELYLLSKGYICLTPTWIFGCFTATDWVVSNEELTQADHFCIKNLTIGDLLHVRVVAVNPGGRSEPGTLPQAVPIREVIGEQQPIQLSPHHEPMKLMIEEPLFTFDAVSYMLFLSLENATSAVSVRSLLLAVTYDLSSKYSWGKINGGGGSNASLGWSLQMCSCKSCWC